MKRISEGIFKRRKATCPHCGVRNDQLGDPDGDRQPKVGDLAVCIDCAGVLQITESGFDKFDKFDTLTADDLEELRNAQACIRHINTVN